MLCFQRDPALTPTHNPPSSECTFENEAGQDSCGVCESERPQPPAHEEEPPDHIVCPLTLEVFEDPVTLAGSGHTYEREAIMGWLDTHGTSPMLRDPATGAFKKIGKTLRPNRVRKDALAKLCRNRPEHVDESSEEEYVEVVEWDAWGLQVVPPTHSRENARSPPRVPQSVVKPPANHPTRAGSITANMTSDLCKMFKALEPLRNELDYVAASRSVV